MLGSSPGYCDFAKRIQPGQQLVNMGIGASPGCVSRCTNSVPSSMIVRSAEKFVSNT